MAKAKVIKSVDSMDALRISVQANAVEYYGLKQMEKDIGKTEEELKKNMTEFLNEHGERDESDKLFYEFGDYRISLEPRRSASINESKAKSILNAKNLYDRVIKTVIDPKAIEELHAEGLLTDKEVESFVIEKVSTAFYVRKQ